MSNGKSASERLFAKLLDCTTMLISILQQETAEIQKADFANASLRIGSKNRELVRFAELMHQMLRLDPAEVAKMGEFLPKAVEENLRRFWTARLENLTTLTAALIPLDPGKTGDIKNFIMLSRDLVDFERPKGGAEIIDFEAILKLLRNNEPPSES